MIARFVNVLLGLWLMVAPAVLGYTETVPVAAKVDRTIGPLVISFAIMAIWPEIRPVRWVNAVLGGAIVLAPIVLRFAVPYTLAVTVSDIVTGLLIMLVASLRGPVRARFGGGWRSIWRDDIDTVSG